MRILRSLSSLCIFALAAIYSSSLIAQSSPTPSRIVSTVDENSLTTLKKQVPAMAASRQYDLGEAPESMPLNNVRLVLSRSDQQEAALDRYLVEVQDASSPNYHKWLTPAQFGQMYGPSDSDIAIITTWLQTRGLKIEAVSAGRTNISFSGTAGQLSQLLHTSIHSFDAHGNRFYSNTSDPQIPSALASVIRGVAHLNTIQPHPVSLPSRQGKISAQTGRLEQIYSVDQSGVRSNLTGGSGTPTDPYFLFLVPGDAATIYDTPNTTFNANYTSGTSFTGHGVTIGIAGDAIFDTTIAQNFRKSFVGDSTAPTITNVDGVGSGDNTNAVGEAYLDVETSGGLAPGAAISFYTSKDLFGAIDRAVNDNKVDILSVSFGSCEEASTAAQNVEILDWWKQAAVQGIAVTVSAGDSGSAGCEDFDTQVVADYGLQVNDLASTPYNIAVGGTDFDALGTSFSTYADTTTGTAATYYRTAKKYIPESTWNDSVVQNLTVSANVPVTDYPNIVAGSGGPSRCTVNTYDGVNVTCLSGYSKPFWQTGPGVPNDGARDLPDVSLMAGDGIGNAAWLMCDNGVVSGTSFHSDCTQQSDGNTYFDASGGTSASSPAFAGILALIQEKTGSRLGQAAQQLYALYNGSHSSDIFHDITTGNNSVPCASGTPNCQLNTAGNFFESGYDTTTGYDLATGMGSLDAKNLVSFWGTGVNPQAPPTASITVTPTPATITNAQSLQVLVTVAAPDTSHPLPTGSVTLVAGNYGIPGEPLANGTYTFTVPAGNIPIGTDTLVVTYNGDTTYGPSIASATVQVTGIPATIKVYPAVPSIPKSDSLPVRVNVGGQYAPTGTVVLSGGGYTSEPLKINTTTYAYFFVIPNNALNVGLDTLTATYSGDANYTAGSASATVTVTGPVSLTMSVIGPVSSQVVAGAAHTCALTTRSITQPEGIECWGSNSHGQLGNGTTTDSVVPVQIDNTTYTNLNDYDISIASLAAGDNHTCALLPATGLPVCWGANASGQLGNGTTTDSSTPVLATALTSRAEAIAAGSAHTCALVSDGTIQCWGDNTHGQLGNGSTTSSTAGVAVSGISSAIAIAAAGNHSCALLSNKTIECWGENSNGQLGNGSTKDSSTPVAVDGLGGSPTTIAAGATHSCALLTDGSLKCWGGNSHGQLGNGNTADSSSPVTVSELTGATALAAGGAHTCAVGGSGTVQCWGSNAKGQLGDNTLIDRDTPVSTAGLTNITSISLGTSNSCAQNGIGVLECWGENANGQLGNGTAQAGGVLSPLPVEEMGGGAGALSMGDTYGCALTAGGTAKLGAGGTLTTNGAPFCWGQNYGQFGDGTSTSSWTPVAVVGLANKVKTLFSDTSNTCAILTDGTLDCWGNGSNGVLGNGSTTSSPTPSKVTGLTGSVIGVSVSQFFACALIADGTVQCWGNNGEGSLGDGTNNNSTTPVKVIGVTNATAITGTEMHTCALISDGTVKCWGDTVATPTTVAGLTNVKAISAGQDFNCAILTDTTVKCWGLNQWGQLGNGTTSNSVYPGPPVTALGLTGVTAISAGAEQACALLADTTVSCWGYNNEGELGNGTTTDNSTPGPVVGLTGVVALSLGGETAIVMVSDGTLQGWGGNDGGTLGDSTGSNSNNLSVDHYVYPVPVFQGQSISFNPPATLAVNSTVDLAPLTTTTDDLTPIFDSWTQYDCEIDFNTGNTAITILKATAPLLCGVRAQQPGGYNLHGGSLAPAPAQERLVFIGAEATAPQATLSPSSLSFDSITVGTTSTAQALTLSNPGNATLNITGITITGTNASEFAQTNTCGSTLAAGASCTLSVTFAPTVAGNASATVSVADNASGSPQTAALTGTTPATATPQAALTPSSADFGSLSIGTTSSAKTFTLANAGDAALPITSAAIGGTNASAFTIVTNTCGTSLAAGASCTLTVTFTPAAAGAASAALSVTDSVGTQSASLTGAGATAAAPQAALTPATADFGNVNVGSASSAQTFTLTNAGNASLPITSVSLGGTNASAFTLGTNACSTSLAAGASCTITVTFNPTAAGSASATLSAVDSVGTQSSTLTATGVALASADFTIAATPAAQTAARGALVAYTVQLGSASTDNPFTNPVTLSATGLPPGATVTFSPASATPGASGAQSTMAVQTTTQLASAAKRTSPWPFAAPVFAALLLLLPNKKLRSRKGFTNLACIVVLLGIAASTIGCGGGFALPSTVKTYTITVTGTSGSDVHSTTVTLTLQ